MWNSRRILCLLMACPALDLAPVTAADPVAQSEQEELIEQILKLRERLEVLLEALPPELQEEVERRWRERSSSAETDPAPAAPLPRSTTDPKAGTDIAEAPAGEAAAIAQQEDCPGLRVFDSSGDGSLSGADRYWRHFRLWLDDGDDRLEDDEIDSLYELGVREIDVELRHYRTGDGTPGDITMDEAVQLRTFGSRPAGRSGRLVIEAERVARAGEYRLIDSTGTSLTGFQVVRPDLLLESSDGTRIPLWCP